MPVRAAPCNVRRPIPTPAHKRPLTSSPLISPDWMESWRNLPDAQQQHWRRFTRQRDDNSMADFFFFFFCLFTNYSLHAVKTISLFWGSTCPESNVNKTRAHFLFIFCSVLDHFFPETGNETYRYRGAQTLYSCPLRPAPMSTAVCFRVANTQDPSKSAIHLK